MALRRWFITLLLVVPVAPVASAAGGGPATAAGPVWGDCPFDVGTSGARCTTVPVPVDYRKPAGASIDLHVARAPAKDPARRLGTLVTSTGGPTAHLSDAAALAGKLPAEVLARYDIVSFDQRGFGRSAPVSCELRPDQQYTIPWPLSGDEAMADRARRIAEQCGPLPHMGTANVARDVDRIRSAVGADKVSLLGISYGTYLATAYDQLFPQRVDRMLLDSVVDAGPGWRGVWRDALTAGVDSRLPDFLAFAAAAHGTYGLGSTADAVRSTILDQIARSDRAPLTTPAGTISGTQLRIALYGAMYNDGAFAPLAGLLAAVRTGDAATAATLATELQVWYDDDNTASGQMAVFCADTRFPRDPAVYSREAAADAARHPLTGGASAAIWPCAFWPTEPIDKPVRASNRGRPNVLLINATRDPATTIGGARNLRRAFGDRARLVSTEYGGHGVYLAAGNACADRIGTDFLLTGARPGADVTCPATHAGLRGELEHLTAVDGSTGALAEVRDTGGTTVMATGAADVRTGAPPRARDRVRIFSNTKTFVATVVLQLVAEGRVDLDAPVVRYLPGLVPADVTVRQILQHTGGLPDFDSSVFEPGRYHADRFDHHTPEELVRAGLSKPRLDNGFHYSTTNYVVAGLLVERVTGRPYAAEVTDRILRPLSLRDTSVPGDDPRIEGPHLRGYAHLDTSDAISDTGRRIDVTPLNPSLVWAGGAMVSTVSDLNTFFTALVGGRLLPPAQLATMMTTVPSDGLVPGSHYGLGLVRVPLSCGGGYWTHGGSGMGYQTRSGVTGDGRAVTLVHTTSPSTDAQSATALRAVDVALCEARV